MALGGFSLALRVSGICSTASVFSGAFSRLQLPVPTLGPAFPKCLACKRLFESNMGFEGRRVRGEEQT